MQMFNITVNKHFKNNYLNEHNAYLFNIYFISGCGFDATVIKKKKKKRSGIHLNLKQNEHSATFHS